MRTIATFTLLASLTAFARTPNARSGVNDKSLIPSYDTTYVEGRDSFRQIYICNRTDRTETFILIKNDSLILWDVDKIR